MQKHPGGHIGDCLCVEMFLILILIYGSSLGVWHACTVVGLGPRLPKCLRVCVYVSNVFDHIFLPQPMSATAGNKIWNDVRMLANNRYRSNPLTAPRIYKCRNCYMYVSHCTVHCKHIEFCFRSSRPTT